MPLVPDEPEVADVPLEPEEPDVPNVPDTPLEPEVPEEPAASPNEPKNVNTSDAVGAGWADESVIVVPDNV
jgi:hypothetical protein